MKDNLNRAMFLGCTFVLVLFSLLTVSNFIHFMTFYNNSSIGGFIFSYIIHAPSSMQLLEIVYILAYIAIVIGLRNHQKRLTFAINGLLGLGVLTVMLNLQSFKLSAIDLTSSIGTSTLYIIESISSAVSPLFTNLITVLIFYTIPLLIMLIVVLIIIYLGLKIFKLYKINPEKYQKLREINVRPPSFQTVVNIIFATLLVLSIFLIVVLVVLRLGTMMNLYNY